MAPDRGPSPGIVISSTPWPEGQLPGDLQARSEQTLGLCALQRVYKVSYGPR